jgi:hypothetical protein
MVQTVTDQEYLQSLTIAVIRINIWVTDDCT